MHYSIHDGPGIRTTVFFKGCPLSCKWCHNPEGFNPNLQKVFIPQKCIHCGRCNKTCPTGAREIIGKEITVPELMKEINKDLPFYEQSNGGVTFSGGEPLYQPEFLLEILEQCRKDCINTAIDTCGYCDTGVLLKAAEAANYFLYDLKFINSSKHEKFCGMPNDLILKNLECLAGTKSKLLIRIPVIPGINDDIREMSGIFEFIKDFNNIETIHLLPYHNIHTDKYKKIGMEYELSGIPGKESVNMGQIENLFNKRFTVRIGG